MTDYLARTIGLYLLSRSWSAWRHLPASSGHRLAESVTVERLRQLAPRWLADPATVTAAHAGAASRAMRARAEELRERADSADRAFRVQRSAGEEGWTPWAMTKG